MWAQRVSGPPGALSLHSTWGHEGQSQPGKLAGAEEASVSVLRAASCSPEPGALPSALSPETALERTPKTQAGVDVSLGTLRVPGGEDPEFPLELCQVGAPPTEVGDCPSEVLLSSPTRAGSES